MRWAGVAALLALWPAPPAEAGHALGHYPSYYPDEVAIDTLDAGAAAKALADETLHAYVGGRPAFRGTVPRHVRPFTSLSAYLVLNLDPAEPAYVSREGRCAAAAAATASFRAQVTPGVVFHPYPVTPFHPDYVHHADRAEAALAVAGAPFPGSGDRSGVRLTEVPVERLAAAPALQLDGWLGPPWSKTGWFQAYRLLAEALDPQTRERADELYGRLVHGDVVTLAEEIELERALVAVLGEGCRRRVVGYRVREEYVNEANLAGAENAAADSHAGLNTPVFIRTAKLKDFPWNGRLHLGFGERPTAAWNPIAGFTDPQGRMIWSALGDPPLLPIPYNAGWAPNRAQFEVTAVHGQSGGIALPDGAVLPDPATGVLKPVVRPAVASAKTAFQVVGSPYRDGTPMAVADAVYPIAFAFRWAATADKAGPDATLARALAAWTERIAGIVLVGVKRDSQNIAENLDIVHETPLLDIYLRNAPGTDDQLAALAAPWTAIPWHLLVLMETAVEQGFAAFSESAASERGIPWLDLVRDPALQQRLLALCRDFERSAFRPPALEPFVTAEDAASRWRALAAFARGNGHLLVTNGPYRLKTWTADSVVLSAVREATYPLGFGTFDHMANPPRAIVRDVSLEPGALVVQADAELTVKVMRRHEVRREPLTRKTAHGLRGVLVSSRYVLFGADGKTVAAGKMSWDADDRLRIPLPAAIPPGRYGAALGVFLDGNAIQPSVKVFRFEIARKN